MRGRNRNRTIAVFVLLAATAGTAGAVDATRERAQKLIKQLARGDADERSQAAWDLGQMKAMEAAPALVAALKDTVTPVRINAAASLGDLAALSKEHSPALKEAVSPLREALKDRSPLARLNAARALRLLGGATHGELAVVVEPLLGHAEADTRDYALEQLLDLDFQDREVRNVLLSGLARGRVEVRKGILRSMEDLSEAQVRSILPDLIRVIQEDRDAEAREKAIWVASKPFISVPRELVPALEKAMRDASERVRTAAAGVMNRAQGQAMEQRLGEIVRGTNDAGDAMKALEEMMGAASETGPVGALLEDLRSGPSEQVRVAAASSLAEMSAQADEVAPALAKALLEDPSQRVRVRASMALGKLPVRDASEEVIRALVQAIGQDKSAAVRAAACATLSRRNYRTAEATLPALTAALNDPDEVVRAEAAEGLRQVKAR